MKKQLFLTIKMDNYVDVTRSWLKRVNQQKKGKIIRDIFFEFNGNILQDGIDNVKLDFKIGKLEKDCANWLKDTFYEDVHLVPRVEKPDGVSTADFIFKNEKWDLKTLIGNKKQSPYRAIRKKSRQSKNFIFDISLSTLPEDVAILETKKLFTRNDTKFLDKIMLVKNKQLIKIYKRKREVTPRR